MEHGCALKRAAVTGLLALLVFAPWGLSRAGELGLGGQAMAQAGYAQDGYAEGGFAIDQFYDELAPFGEWVDHPGHGYVWLPRTVAPDWRPYTIGNWIYTDEYGWYWDSSEPFAWAVYHYGRWGYDPAYGWYWVPGDTWAPAWVQWRYGDEYIGWAPEAPAPSGAYAYGGPAAYAPPPPQAAWVFVQPRYLTAPAVRTYAVPQTVISIAFSRSTYVYRPEYRNGYVYNYGMPRDRWSRISRQHIEPRKVHRGHSRSRPKDWNGQRSRDLYVYAPAVKKGAAPRTPPKTVVHRPSKATAAKHGTLKSVKEANEARRDRWQAYGPGGGKPTQANRWPSGPQADKLPHAKSSYKVDKPKDAKAGAPRGRPRGPMAVGAPGGAKPPQVKRPPVKPQAGKPPAAKPNATKARAGKPKEAKVGAPRGRPQGPIAVGTPGGGKPSQVNRPPSKPQAGKPPATKPNAARPKADKPKDAKTGASRGRPHGPMAVGSPPGGGKSGQVKRAPSKPAAAKAKAPQPKAAKTKANEGKGTKTRGSKANGANAKSKSAKAAPGPAPRGSAGGGGKSGGPGKGGGDRAAACKAKPDLPFCGRRGG